MAYIARREEFYRDIITGGYETRTGGRRGRPNYAGPLGEDIEWERDSVRGYFQTVPNARLVDIEYRATDGTSIQIYQITTSDLTLIDNTLNLVPPSHLRWFNRNKPEGIILDNVAGRGRSARYTGGLNPGYDNSATDFFDERAGIIITYGAIWRFRYLGISPTVLHEIGHVMTRSGNISYSHFPESRREELRSTRASRNPGVMEALCNAYMYLICYGSDNPAIHGFGSGGDSQRDSSTRAALRRCPAFSTMIDEEWRNRFAER